MRARAVYQPKKGQLNRTEAAYAAELERQKQAGLINWFGFEVIRLRLAPSTGYTPDFVVITSQGEVEMREVKGFWRDDAKVKVKLAAALYPFFRFVVVTAKPKRDGGGFNLEDVA